MVSYRYMYMSMDGVDGSFAGYMMRPESMDMQMHMVGAMYTPTDNLTIGMMMPYIVNEMDMLMAGNPTSMESEGWGDLKLSGIYRVWSNPAHQLLLNLGVSFPTGSVDEKNAAGNRMPYPMQLGSGSYGLIPGITYSGLSNGWGWGAQANGTFYLDENKHDYTLGNRYGLSMWGLRDLCRSSAVSLRLSGSRTENINGADTGLVPPPAMSPLADPDLRAGTRMDLLAGIDFRRGNLRLALEGGAPVYQELDGPQLKTAWLFTGGVQVSF